MSEAIERRGAPSAPRLHLPVHLDVAGGRRLLVREVRAGDIPRLEALYDGLDETSRYRRFFTVTGPGRDFFDRLVAVGERGGACIVVIDMTDVTYEEETAHDRGPIVAEGSYNLLESGNAEVAVTVERRWRGWMGPYLLDVLCRHAADRGIPNLEAEILTTNRAMRALSRSRGEAMAPGSDWQTVRAVFSTTRRLPHWPSNGRPKVLVEVRGGSWDALDALSGMGFEVLACPGPSRQPSGCPLLRGEECPLAASADAVLVALPDDADREALLAAHADRQDGPPVVVVQRRSNSPGDPAPFIEAADQALMTDLAAVRRAEEVRTQP